MLLLNKVPLFVCRQVFYLVDDVLILALGLEVNRETNNGSDGSTYTTRPEQGVHQQVVVLLVNLVGEPSQPQKLTFVEDTHARISANAFAKPLA